MTFQYWQSRETGRWYWRLVDAGGGVLAVSVPYVGKTETLAAVKAVKRGVAGATVQEYVPDAMRALWD